VISVAVSGLVSLVLAAAAWRGAWRGKLAAVAIVIMVIIPLIKLSFAFICESHFFSAVTLECVPVYEEGM